jgi:hypothetical protein
MVIPIFDEDHDSGGDASDQEWHVLVTLKIPEDSWVDRRQSVQNSGLWNDFRLLGAHALRFNRP